MAEAIVRYHRPGQLVTGPMKKRYGFVFILNAHLFPDGIVGLGGEFN